MRNLLFATGIFFGTILVLVNSPSADAARKATGSDDWQRLPVMEYRDRLKGGFVGQMVGVTYGVPFEFKFNGNMVPEWMLPDWRPGMIMKPWLSLKFFGALGQDDIYVELTFLETIEKHGLDVSMEQIGLDFGNSRYPLWHANKAARNNIRDGIMPPLSGHPRYNEHADDIDFQIEADMFGLISPGMSRAVQEITWRFGHVMNYGDAVYGGVFISSMYSAAFFQDDRVKVVEAGLAAIPAESNYARTITDVLDSYRKDPNNWKAAWRVIEKKWGSEVHCPSRHFLYPWEHVGIGANINGAYVVIGLLYGKGDPLETIRIATMCGRDADCNPASAMGVLGTMIGFELLPESFKSELPGMSGRNFSYTSYDYEGAVEAMERQAREMLRREGGRVEHSSGKEVWLIPTQIPQTLPLEQWPYHMPSSEVPLP